ncbi:hypothetical protein [Pseudomonas taeanensis]|jgi:hypothetical protein|uniref:hypothetical protein n=1 Tax=Pseudomonas taeanensis TaxID=574962 RepID=UPI00128EC8D2|nr:hypothetical protein [Pseudomonas taeanensis]
MKIKEIKNLVATGIIILISGCGWSPSEEEKIMSEKACKNLLDESMRIFTTGENAPKVFDTYTKNGKLVMEIGYKIVKYQGHTEPYSVRLCVVDLEKKTVTLPSPLNYSEWRK